MWNFIKSSSLKDNWLEHNFNEVCFVGRSNVGKSSLINALSNNNKLAKTSKTPGRTQLINYFDSGEGVMIIDLPGYGFAKVSKMQKIKMHEMMNEYFTESIKLSQIFLLFDTRHGLLEEDLIFYNYLLEIGHKISLVGTKMDRTTQSERSKMLKNLIISNISSENVFLCSSKTKKNIDELRNFIYSFKLDSDK